MPAHSSPRPTRGILRERSTLVQPTLVRLYGVAGALVLQQLHFMVPRGVVHRGHLYVADPAFRIHQDTGAPLQLVRWQLRFLCGFPRSGKPGGQVLSPAPVSRLQIFADRKDLRFCYTINYDVVADSVITASYCGNTLSPATESVSPATLRKTHTTPQPTAASVLTEIPEKPRNYEMVRQQRDRDGASARGDARPTDDPDERAAVSEILQEIVAQLARARQAPARDASHDDMGDDTNSER